MGALLSLSSLPCLCEANRLGRRKGMNVDLALFVIGMVVLLIAVAAHCTE